MSWLRSVLPRALVRWMFSTLLVGTAGVFVFMWYASAHSSASPAYQLKFDFQSELASSPSADWQPEDYLLHIQSLLSRSEYAQAIELSENLVNAYPNFQVGQWLYADLLSLTADTSHADPLDLLSTLDAKDKKPVLQGLQTELSRRLQALRTPYPSNTVPSGLGYLAPSTEYLAVVDASTSRMYVFKNHATPETPLQLELLFHSYASVGLNGIHKQQEGDGRSPIGVYFTQRLLPDKRLPDLYGSGALTLNYPNFYDVHQGRTGSGIWIHGTPSAQYSRAPQASDGCIVLPNDSMRRLLALGNPKGIPIFIQEKIDWVAPQQALQMPGPLGQQVSDRYLAGQALTAAAAGTPDHYAQLGIQHFLSWRDQDQQVVLIDLATPQKGLLRTYWVEHGQGWNLVSESRM